MDNEGQTSHNVVSMTQNISDKDFTPLAQVEAYWDALRGTRLMPLRSEIDPRGIEGALEYAFIIERIAPGIARLRIAGSHLNDLMGMEVRGMPLTAFFAPGSRRQVSDILEEVFETPATCVVSLQSGKAPGAPALAARLLLMPLKSDLGDVSRLLGALVTAGDIGRSPRRFDIVDAKLKPILSEESVPLRDPARPVAAPNLVHPKAQLPGFSDAKAPFQTETPNEKAPYLRLVKSDDT